MIRLRSIGLRYKLFLGLAIIGVALLLVVYFVTSHFILADVTHFLVLGNIDEAGALTTQLVDYYSQHGGWDGVSEVIDKYAPPGWHGGDASLRGNATGRLQFGEQVLLTDSEGTVIHASSTDLNHDVRSANVLSEGIPLLVQGREVGRLFTGAMLGRFSGLEDDLLASIRRSVGITALISLFMVVIIGAVLLRLITAPFGRLISETQLISSGDLTHPVLVRTQDEIGKLARVLDNLRVNLARSEDVRRHMLADIAHELRNPLAILRAKVEAMLDGIQLPDEGNLNVLNDRLLHLSHLVDELQDIALAEAGELPLDVDIIDLRDLLHDVEGDARALLAGENKVFRLDLPVDVRVVCADRRRLLQVLWNLISNAIRHTSAGDVVSVRVEPHPEGVLIQVRDSGEGMDEETVSHVFDRFYRGNRASTSRDRGSQDRVRKSRVSSDPSPNALNPTCLKPNDSRPSGLGLGLAITRELVRAHGGEISVDSHLEEGTTFSFTLPWNASLCEALPGKAAQR